MIKRLPNSSNGRARWLCRCFCGQEFDVRSEHLRRGNTRSCGCLQKKRTSEACKKNLMGQTFGFLEVIKEDPIRASNGHVKWICRCKCGNITSVDNNYLTTGKTISCGCSIASKGETKIQSLLEDNKICFEKEKKFDNLRFEDTKRLARYDFYLPDYNCLIEYDGVQHFIQRNGVYDNQEKFQRTQEHDKIKNQYAKENNIKLIRIPYTELDNININYLLPETSKFLIK